MAPKVLAPASHCGCHATPSPSIPTACSVLLCLPADGQEQLERTSQPGAPGCCTASFPSSVLSAAQHPSVHSCLTFYPISWLPQISKTPHSYYHLHPRPLLSHMILLVPSPRGCQYSHSPLAFISAFSGPWPLLPAAFPGESFHPFLHLPWSCCTRDSPVWCLFNLSLRTSSLLNIVQGPTTQEKFPFTHHCETSLNPLLLPLLFTSHSTSPICRIVLPETTSVCC